jgi:hypothetical protein
MAYSDKALLDTNTQKLIWKVRFISLRNKCAEVLGRSEASQYVNCGGHSDTGALFFVGTSVLFL